MTQAIVERACSKLRSAIEDDAVVLENFTGGLLEMLDVLEVIQPVLDEAQMQALRDEPASLWLQSVRVAACSITDMVDELQDTRSQAAASMTRMLPKSAIRKNAIKMKESTELVMGLKKELHTIFQPDARIYRRTTGPDFEEALVFGRELDKQRIVAVLLSAEGNIVTQGLPSCIILPIYGLAGSGKTTLARMVFKDTATLQNYDFRVWVHVLPEFNFHRIGEDIVYQASEGKQKAGGMGYIMKRLHKLLHGKKVLLVLDDLWEEDPIQFQLLKSMLTFLADKVNVIVTTCNKAIARKISTIEPYRLNPLSDDTCWEIIKKSTRSGKENEEELEQIGREMARKCRGLPLVARAFVDKLDSRDPTSWREIMATNMSNILFGAYSKCQSLHSTLGLCHGSMPPGLRLCFAYYCDIFPKGHNILKDDLIHQWIALHLTEPSSEILSATQIAEDYITRLLDMSFLQIAKSEPVSGNDDMGATSFTMHDLPHYYARSLVDKFTERSLEYKLVTNCGGNLDGRYDKDLRALRCLDCSKLEFKDDSFSRKKSLCVLELKESFMQKLPDSMCKLRQLCYLKISDFTGLVTLPESFGHLTYLFHVDLSGCSGLINLPESFGKLILLVYVNLSGCSGLETLPESFGNLISLVHINLSGCSELGTLPESFGKLIRLVHVNLSGCYGLVNLPGSFGRLTNLFHVDLSDCSRLINLPESFGKLILLVHVNLSGCSRLATLPESFGDLMSLSHLNLSRCHALTEIPEPLQKLGKLAHLDLSFWSCFERIGEGLGGLTNLQHLNLSHPCCHLPRHHSNLQQLKDGLCKLTSLSYLNLSMCLNPIFYYKSEEESLHYIESCVSSLSSLEHLDLSHNTFLFDLPESLGDLNKLHTLDLSGCIRLKRIGEMKSLKFIALKNCRGLESCNFVVHVDDEDAYSSNIVQLEDVNFQELQISCLEKVRYKEEAQRIKLVEKQKLKKLKLSWTLDSIRSVEERALLEDSVLLGELVPPPNLECLEVNNYSGTCLPEYFGELTSLQELKIVRCRQLNSLPASINKLSNLKDLSIFHCPELEKWCQLEENKKTLAHIPNKNYEEHGGTSRLEIEEDGRSISKLEAKEGCVDVL